MTKKLVLAVIDGCKPSMLRRAIDTGRAPALAAIAQRGTNVDACVAAFPSVTPVCAAAIATGTLQDVHHIPSMNWYSRREGRYVEYGSSFAASWKFGLGKQLTDTVYNMNAEHLNPKALTVFEALDDQDVRTAGTTYLMYRGRHEHRPSKEFALSRVATSTFFRKPILGPREFFYADLFASQVTGCFSQMGMPGVRDQHTGCVGAYLAEHDLFDFMLFSLPDNDAHSHKHGPHAQVQSIAAADRQLERLFHAAGGTDAFLDQHAVIVVADHSHAPVEATIDLAGPVAANWEVLRPSGARSADAEVAVCPASRSAMLYLLQPGARDEALPGLIAAAREPDGVDLVMWRDGEEAVIAGEGGELRFAPGDDVTDERGRSWTLHGEPGALQSEIAGGRIENRVYPDALSRVWAALTCPTSGDVLLSASPGWEFPDWGGQAHVGGGSHGSLHRVDSEGALLYSGVNAGGVLSAREDDGAWSITDIAPIVVAHFGAR
ncbi:MAG: alkaline phosphatase family protein [Solirubrobacteraceae bacterium]|nr:alkaline phosphatase family protein [Solirubrobacteraceae bacterium]